MAESLRWWLVTCRPRLRAFLRRPSGVTLQIIRDRLGSAVKDILFDRDIMLPAALSPQHNRALTERTAGPIVRLVEALTVADPAKLAALRREYDAITAEYFEENAIRQGYLMTRATKV